MSPWFSLGRKDSFEPNHEPCTKAASCTQFVRFILWSLRDTEYREVVERVPQFLAEIEMKTARGRATYAEVEESEQRCREPLAAFETAALAAYNADVENSA